MLSYLTTIERNSWKPSVWHCSAIFGNNENYVYDCVLCSFDSTWPGLVNSWNILRLLGFEIQDFESQNNLVQLGSRFIHWNDRIVGNIFAFVLRWKFDVWVDDFLTRRLYLHLYWNYSWYCSFNVANASIQWDCFCDKGRWLYTINLWRMQSGIPFGLRKRKPSDIINCQKEVSKISRQFERKQEALKTDFRMILYP